MAEVTRPPSRHVGSESRMEMPIKLEQKRIYWWFVLPAVVLYTVLFALPALGTLWISFHKWPGSGPMEWVGVRNYRILWHDPTFTIAFVNTLKILFIVGGATFLVSFFLMMVLRDLAGKGFVRASIFFPNILSGVVIAILWGFLFQADGLVNQFLLLAGISDPPKWLNENMIMNVVMVGLVWVQTGFFTTILMAGADRIPKHLYEDCALAGAGTFQQFRFVTLPLMWEVLCVAAVLWTISSIKIFEFILAFAGATGFLPPVKAWNTAIYSYAEAFSGEGTPKYGTSSASAVVMLVLVVVLVFLLRRLMRRETLQF